MKATKYIRDDNGQLVAVHPHTGEPVRTGSKRSERVLRKWMKRIRMDPPDPKPCDAPIHRELDPDALHDEHLRFERTQRAKQTKRFSAYGKHLRTNLAAPFIVRLRKEARKGGT